MEAFEYARPKSIQEAIKLLTGTRRGSPRLGRGHRPHQLDEGRRREVPSAWSACNTSTNLRKFPSGESQGCAWARA